MINLMVDDMDGILERCAQHDVTPLQRLDDEPNGRFAHILDPEGRKLELWEPKPMAG
jgi:predicted enzyme related to lactoylglutathione lyase